MIRIAFDPPDFPPIELSEDAELSRALNVMNSPLLFGCRSGLCGTCLVEIADGADALPPPSSDEVEALEVYAPGNPRARLTCQLRAIADITLRKIESV